MRDFINNLVLNPFVLFCVGGVAAFIGAFVVTDIPDARRRLGSVEELAAVGAASPGQAAFVEGRVSERTPAVYREFVAYVREEYRSCGRSSCWVEVARETPPLLIDTPGGEARIANDDYELETVDVSVEEAPPSHFKGAVRSRGFVAGSPVLAVGRVAEEGRVIAAEFLYAGTRAEYITHLRGYVSRTIWWGGGFLLGGAACLATGLWSLRRFLREIRNVNDGV